MAEPVGVIGLGLVGSALAERFLGAGLQVFGYDPVADQLRPLEALGGHPTGSAAEVATHCKRLVFSLPTSAVVLAVLEEIDGELEPDNLIVDTTTGEPERTAAIAARLAERGVQYVDATIAGSSAQVRAGQVVVMAGGDALAYERAQELLSAFSERSFHVGPAGSGALMKLVVNLVLGLNRAVLAEGLSFAERSGLSAALALEVLKSGAAYSKAMDTKGQKMLDRDFEPQARLAQHLKDVRLILATAERTGAIVPLSKMHKELLERAEAAGLGEQDNSAIVEVFRDLP